MALTCRRAARRPQGLPVARGAARRGNSTRRGGLGELLEQAASSCRHGWEGQGGAVRADPVLAALSWLGELVLGAVLEAGLQVCGAEREAALFPQLAQRAGSRVLVAPFQNPLWRSPLAPPAGTLQQQVQRLGHVQKGAGQLRLNLQGSRQNEISGTGVGNHASGPPVATTTTPAEFGVPDSARWSYAPGHRSDSPRTGVGRCGSIARGGCTGAATGARFGIPPGCAQAGLKQRMISSSSEDILCALVAAARK